MSDIDRASMFLEQAEDVRKGNRSNRTSARAAQASGSKRKCGEVGPVRHVVICAVVWSNYFTSMAGKHGARVYYQVLLSPNRANLVDELAKEAGVKIHSR